QRLVEKFQTIAVVRTVAAFAWVIRFPPCILEIVDVPTKTFQSERVLTIVPSNSADGICGNHARDYCLHRRAISFFATLSFLASLNSMNDSVRVTPICCDCSQARRPT